MQRGALVYIILVSSLRKMTYRVKGLVWLIESGLALGLAMGRAFTVWCACVHSAYSQNLGPVRQRLAR